MVKIDSGPVEPTDKFDNTPRDKWGMLLIAKRSFLSWRLEHDCRCLIEFCEEAELVYAELGFKSAVEMIREGYELEPSQVELAVAWLKANGTEKAIGIGDIQAKVAEAKENPAKDKKGGRPPKDEAIKGSNFEPLPKGNDNKRVLARISRDRPDLLDKIESGELSVNAAAIQAGIRKKPSQEEICVKAFRKAENRLQAIRLIIDTLEPHEAAVVRDWAMEKLN